MTGLFTARLYSLTMRQSAVVEIAAGCLGLAVLALMTSPLIGQINVNLSAVVASRCIVAEGMPVSAERPASVCANWKKAVTYATEAIRWRTNLGHAWYFGGLAMLRRQDYEQAIQFLSVTPAGPPDLRRTGYLGLAYELAGDLNSAAAIWRSGQASSFLVWLAHANELQHHLASAEHYYQLALSVDDSASGRAQIARRLGDFYANQGRHAEAIQAYTLWVENVSSPAQRAYGYYQMGLFSYSGKLGVDRAIDYFRQAVLTQPDYRDAYLAAAFVLSQSGRNEEAAAWRERAQKLDLAGPGGVTTGR